MDNKVLDIIKEKPIIIPRVIFNNYRKLNITEEELVILIYIINIGDKILYNPEIFVKELNMDKFKVMEIINSLLEKKLLSLLVEKNKTNKIEEYLSLDLFYNKILNLVLEVKEEINEEDKSNIFSLFEQEFGRTLSPMEYEIIKGWINDKIAYEIIVEALKEATYNGVTSLRYIEKIIFEWKKKGFKTKSDILKDKENYKKKKQSQTSVFDYNWLDDE